MNASLLPEILLRQDCSPQADLDLATEGVLRYVWSSQWGDMLIETRKGVVYVNGQKVEAAPALVGLVALGPASPAPESSKLNETKNR